MAKSTEQRLPKLYRQLQTELLSAGWKVVSDAAGDEYLDFIDPSGNVRVSLQFNEEFVDVYPNGLWKMWVPMRDNTVKLETVLHKVPSERTHYVFFAACYGNFRKAAEALHIFLPEVK